MVCRVQVKPPSQENCPKCMGWSTRILMSIWNWYITVDYLQFSSSTGRWSKFNRGKDYHEYRPNNAHNRYRGSVIYSEKGIRHLKNNIVIYLRTDFRVLTERTNNFTDRGVLFNGKSPIEMYKERDIIYESVCDVTIDCHNMRILDIAQVVKNLLPT